MLKQKFKNPDINFKPRPLWFWNGPVSKEYIEKELEEAKKIGYGGVAILPASGYTNNEYLSEGFFEDYRIAVNKARELGLKLCIYDEFDFPSGKMGTGVNSPFGMFDIKYPNDTSKRLDKLEEDVANFGNGEIKINIPNDGAFMGAVAMNVEDNSITVLSNEVGDRCIKDSTNITITDIPFLHGQQKIIVFMCVRDETNPVVDYLEPDAVEKFIANVHEKYYKYFSDDFVTVIDSTFYDEPRMWGTATKKCQNTIACKMWTPKYNKKFADKYGFSPLKYYPALWYDIGNDTSAARNMLFGVRAELFAQGYFKTINDWCDKHGISFTGHIEGEENINPTGSCGDLIKVFKYQGIPGIDEVYDYYAFENEGFYGRTSKSFKLVSSSAFNYDKPLVMTETNGASGNGDANNLNKSSYRLYKEAFDQLTKGINYFVPHAILTSYDQPVYFPDLSYKNDGEPNYAKELPFYNDFLGRAQLLLQGGRHIADIGVLYPIETLQAGFKFDSGALAFESAGSLAMPEADYMNVGELLSLNVRRDYTFLHPEVIVEKCNVEGNVFKLNNTNNYEEYKVIIMPGSKVVSFEVLNKIQEFYNNGGKVIFTKCLPNKSSEVGHDLDIAEIINSMLGEYKYGPLYTASSHKETANINCMYEPSLAGDYNLNSKWISGGDAPVGQWLEIDFSQPKTFDGAYIKEFGNSITEYVIEYYNGTNWDTCYVGNKIGEGAVKQTFDAVKASKVRILFKGASKNFVAINEFHIYHHDANLCFPIDMKNKHCCGTNSNGGKAYFIPNANEDILRQALDDAIAIYDVEIPPQKLVGGNFSYIHKVKDGLDIYYFANSSDSKIDTYVNLRGTLKPQMWNPYTGEILEIKYLHQNNNGEDFTRINIKLDEIKSIFIIS